MVSIVTLYYNILILWDHRRICGPSLTKRYASPVRNVLRHVDITFLQATGTSDTSDVRQPYADRKPPYADP